MWRLKALENNDTSNIAIETAITTIAQMDKNDEAYKKYIDWNLWVRLMKHGKHFQRIPFIITDYYLHEDMKSKKVKK